MINNIDFTRFRSSFLLARVNVSLNYLLSNNVSDIRVPDGYDVYWLDGMDYEKWDKEKKFTDIVSMDKKNKARNIEFLCVRRKFDVEVPFGFRFREKWRVSGSCTCSLDAEKLLYDFVPKSWTLCSSDGLNFEFLSEYYVDPDDLTAPQKGLSIELREKILPLLVDELESEVLDENALGERVRSAFAAICSKTEFPRAITIGHVPKNLRVKAAAQESTAAQEGADD